MIAENLISTSIIPLQTSDTGEVALEMMEEFFVRHLPIVNNQELLGLLSEEDVLNFDPTEPVGSYSLSLSRPYVRHNDHVYEIMRLISDQELSIIPVVDEDNNYLGVVTLEDLLRFFVKTAPFAEPGSIVVLEINKGDYFLSNIARIAESENVTILSTFITSFPDSSRMEVTLKLNTQNSRPLLAALERYNYSVKASFQEIAFDDSLKERYDALMTYLNI